MRPEGKRGGRPLKYWEGFVKVLSAIRDDYGKPCGKLLVPMTGGMIDFLAESEDPKYGITEEIRGLLLEVSAAETDSLLKPAREAYERDPVKAAEWLEKTYPEIKKRAKKEKGDIC